MNFPRFKTSTTNILKKAKGYSEQKKISFKLKRGASCKEAAPPIYCVASMGPSKLIKLLPLPLVTPSQSWWTKAQGRKPIVSGGVSEPGSMKFEKTK